MAGRYNSDCANGHRGNPTDNQPIEDAEFNANCAWKSCQELIDSRYET
jgi:hypothetical protein